MTRTIKAVYENGLLRLLQPLEGVPDRTRVDVTIMSPDEPTTPNTNGAQGIVLRECIGILPNTDAAEMSRVIDEEFEKVDPRDW